LQGARFGWFDRARKAYRDIPINEQVELISLIGDVGLVNGAPQIHAHGAVGFPDGQMRGGHLLEAIVWPTVEIFFTSCPIPLVKEHDVETDLSLFDLKSPIRHPSDDSGSARNGSYSQGVFPMTLN